MKTMMQRRGSLSDLKEQRDRGRRKEEDGWRTNVRVAGFWKRKKAEAKESNQAFEQLQKALAAENKRNSPSLFLKRILEELQKVPRINRASLLNRWEGSYDHIKNGHQLASVLRVLEKTDRQWTIFQIGRMRLEGMIENVEQLVSTLETLFLKDRKDALRCLSNDYLRTLIQNGDQLASILHVLRGSENCSCVFEKLGDRHLRVIIQKGELKLVMKELNRVERLDFIERLGQERLLALIQDGYDVRLIINIKNLSPDQRVHVVTNIIGYDRLRVLIKDGYQLSGMLSELPRESGRHVLKGIGSVHLRTMIHLAYELNLVLLQLSRGSQADLLTRLGGDHLWKLISPSRAALDFVLSVLFMQNKVKLIQLIKLSKVPKPHSHFFPKRELINLKPRQLIFSFNVVKPKPVLPSGVPGLEGYPKPST